MTHKARALFVGLEALERLLREHNVSSGIRKIARSGKREKKRCYRPCNFRNIPLVVRGINVTEQEKKQLLKFQRLPLSSF